MTIAAILQTKGSEVTKVSGDARVGEVVALLSEKRIGAVPVVDDSGVIGIFSERDIIHGLAREGAAALDRQVREVMTAPAITVTSDNPILAALSLMTTRRVRHLPVVEGGTMIGFVSIGDLVKRRIDHIEQEAEALRSYIQSS